MVVQPPGSSRRVWRPRAKAPTPPSDQPSEPQSDDDWTGQRPPVVPGWGEDAAPRSRRAHPEPAPPAHPSPAPYRQAEPGGYPPAYQGEPAGYQAEPAAYPPPHAPDRGAPYGDPAPPETDGGGYRARRAYPEPEQGLHGPADEPTWASSSLGLEGRPATASQWHDSGEPTWGGTAARPRAQAPSPSPSPRPSPRPAEPAPVPETAPMPEDMAGPGEDGWLRLEEEPAQETWRDRATKAATPFRRRRGGIAGRVTWIAIASVLCLALIGGGIYLWQSGGPTLGDETKYLDGVSTSSVISRVEGEGFECIPGRTIAQCEKQITGADLSITVHFASEGEVSKIEASGGTAAYSDEEVKPEELQSFFEMAAALPLSSSSGDAGAAKDWAKQHVGTEGQETIGGVRYESAGDQPLLVMTPAA
ncbi:MAG: hypothetical protein ACRDT4_19055 [Micromonosporaceae bacterium]